MESDKKLPDLDARRWAQQHVAMHAPANSAADEPSFPGSAEQGTKSPKASA